MNIQASERREWSAPADPKQCVATVFRILSNSDPSPESKERPLNYTQLQLEVQAAMAYELAAGITQDTAEYYSHAFQAIQCHMQSRFNLGDLTSVLVNASKSAYACAKTTAPVV